uniref:Synaptobrevin, longin-like domain protein n=1 Tax=Tanacetum cinerariifolium TaxID=118510 RepID=A0A699HIE4_TANCI|nr:hypothetical protein [Tanacetum cinerariifolium]
MALTFADTHNMIAYLNKSDTCEGFEQILDFLNARMIQYELTVKPTIYISSIKQFWSSVLVKKVNDVVRLQALIDRRKVILTEDTVRQALHLDDAASIDYFPNKEIFAELARIGYEKPSTKLTFYKAFFLAQWKFLIHTILQCMSAKRTVWNEFSSSMASVVICLAIGRTFNFSKYIFDSLVRNVHSSSKFYMYPRFLQLMISAQVGDLSSHTTKYTSPALTQKVFSNIRKIGKGFSRVDTPLFEGMLVPQQVADDVVAKDAVEPPPPSPTPTTTPPPQELLSTSQGRQEESQAHVYHIDLEHADKVLIIVAAITITAAPSATRRRKGVVIRDLEETATPSTIVPSEPKSKDKRKGILVEEPKPLNKQAQIEQDEAYARELEAELNKNIKWYDVIE